MRRARHVARVAEAKHRDAGRSTHWRAGKGRASANGAGEATKRGGKGSSKTTRSQRTNKSYKVHVSGRPTIDDVERASRGGKTKSMGVVEREAPYRLTRDEREAWERAKRRGGLETRSASRDGLARRRFPLVNTHRAHCDAVGMVFVCTEQDVEGGEDRVVVDVSTLRASEDGEARARLRELATALGASAEDLCGDEEPLMAQMRYVAAMEGGFERTALVEVLEGDAEAEPAPSESEIAAARDAVSAAAVRVREMKDSGKSNADDDVKAGVRCLLEAKAKLGAMEAAAEKTSAAANEAAEVDLEADLKRIEEAARRSLVELPIHGLPERYMRFKCPDRPTAKALSKAIAKEDLAPLLLEV